jgi:hypothetical protein
MAPDIYFAGSITQSNLYVSVEDPITADLRTFLKRPHNQKMVETALKCLLDKKYVIGLLHGDMHLENIAVLKDGRTLGFIDFDFSAIEKNKALTVPDFVPLITSIKTFRVGASILPYILRYYKNTFNITINISKLKVRNGGGFIYDNKITSYPTLTKNWNTITEIQLNQIFPKLTLPTVID